MKGNEGHGGPALTVSIHHHGYALPLRCWQRRKNVGERKSGGGRVAEVQGLRGGDVTNVWSSCLVYRVPDPLPPGQQQPQYIHNGGGGNHCEAVHSSQTDPGVGIHLQAFGQDEIPLGAAAGGHCHHN